MVSSSSSSSSDVLVLGAGVIGLSCALHLLEAGASVRVLDRGTVGCGTSHGNCGTITPSHAAPLCRPGLVPKALRWMLTRDAPLYVSPQVDFARWRWLLGFARHCNQADYDSATLARAAILTRSRALLESQVQAHGLQCEFAPSGMLYVFRDPAQFAAECHEHDTLAALGIQAHTLDADATMNMEPALRDGVCGGVYFPNDAQLRPDRFVAELARRVRELGGRIDEGVEIGHLQLHGDRVTAVHCEGEDVSAGQIVAALGPWTTNWARHMGLRVPIQPGKGYSQTWSRPTVCPRLPLVLADVGVCVTSWDSGFRLGSTMEFSGYDERLNPLRLAALERGAARFLHEPTGPHRSEQWWGWRPMCVDDVPIIGRSARIENLLWATGHGMLGVSMSTATGELVSSLCTDTTPELDPRPYSPARFQL